MTAQEIVLAAIRLARSGEPARAIVAGDPMFGGTVNRYGTVACIGGTAGQPEIVFAGDLHDCAGIAERSQRLSVSSVKHLAPQSFPIELVRW